ncbi:MAG: BREX-1 system phosphatase PglZ type A, partial [Gammaproteobacteria bacterium]|nr:BREX-1 system phosphatase PglZ type A [Gammaproteobacteria bacterium]
MAEEAVEDDIGLEDIPHSMLDLAKYDLVPSLVAALQDEVGYPASVGELNGEEQFKFGHFLIRLLTTGFCESIGDIPVWGKDLAISSGSAKATSRALLSRWRDSSRYYKAFDVVSDWVSEALRISEKLDGIELGSLAQVATFEAVERQIIVEIAQVIPQADQLELNSYAEVIANRLDNYWASRHKDDDTRKKYRVIYKALSSAIDLFSLRHSHSTGFHYSNVHDLYKAYENNLYKFDLAYRHYSEASYRAHVEVLKKLDDAVEQCYSNWFIDNLASNWGDKIDSEAKLSNWQIEGVENQQNFYIRQVLPAFSKAKNSRVVV